MKKNVIYLFTLATLFFGCSEEFLEPVRNTSILTNVSISENAELNPALIEGNLNGISGFIAEPFGTLGATAARHYDIGQKGIDIFSDIVAGDMALATSSFGWYNASANTVVTTDFTRQENNLVWNYYYRIIGVANSVIQTSGGNNPPDGTAAGVLRINAQAKAYRAYSYFYLTQFLQTAYDPNEEILPLYAIDEVITSKVEASMIYDLIVSDLTFAVENLQGYTRAAKNEIDQSVARGLLAYTYAAMGDYTNAKVQADAIIASGAYPLTTRGQLAFPGQGSGFTSVNTPSWMWGFDNTPELGVGLVSWWGQIDYFTYSYASAGDTKSIDNLLYSQIPDTDIRKTQFVENGGFAPLQPLNKFFDAGRVQGGQGNVTTDYIYMRIEEFYLLSAECAAKLGNEAEAKQRLSTLLSIRLDGGGAEATSYLAGFSGQALIDEVYFQTRVEMWGEGKTYLAMKRNQATVTRGSNHLFLPNTTFEYDSDEMSFQIPETEIINNPNISSQNN
ncbi:RagB/SusD family nutrient uptake outer membrane protein [Winogradskyella forsetii]|uniref:RagB/SusD family nutrient uptake outer membrane protein n=1 Tax=Winogradskyella forsetii TaxID=2686077 RepID=UPI0015C0BE74|nr:RagB/SusD family nutrient uptake outer membrane protein [Winogradskyella forsetii]